MPIDLLNPAYPFDPTGTRAANKIVGEQQIINGVAYRDYHFIVPKFGPIFADGAVVKYRPVSGVQRTLVEGVDFYFSHWFISASRACAKPIYGSISLLNTQLTGLITLDYQTLGGIWTIDEQQIAAILADNLHNPRITAWDEVSNMPTAFPPIDHAWDLVDMVGAKDIVTAIQGIEAVLRQTGEGGITDHIANLDNPHQTNKSQIGLGSVLNFGIASISEANAGIVNDKYMTPALVLSAITTKALTPLNAHVGNTTNPHGTTADQVGAYTKAVVNTMLDGKLGTQQTAYDTNRFDGKSAIEYRDWALLGTSANSLKLNGLTVGQLTTQVLLGTAANATHLSGHTYEEIIATVSSGVADDTTLFAGRNFAQATAEILSGKASNSDKIDGKTYPEAKADILSGDAANALRLGGKTYAETKADILLGKAADSDKLDGKTYTQVLANLSGLSASQYSYPPISMSGNRWLPFGKLTNVEPTDIPDDLFWIVTGGNTTDRLGSPVYQVSVTFRDPAAPTVLAPKMTVTRISGPATGDDFGVRYSSGTKEMMFWMKTAGTRAALHITDLARQAQVIVNTSIAVLNAEPAGSVRAEFSAIPSGAELAALRAEMEAAIETLTDTVNNLNA
jgi:hypothetical protein